jgi:hypothetical protein
MKPLNDIFEARDEKIKKRSFARSRRAAWASPGGDSDPLIVLSAYSIAEGISGRTVAIISVVNGTGVYTFSITADAGNKFDILNDDELTLDNAVDYETATSYNVTIEADNGVDDPISQVFNIGISNVPETTLNALTLDNDTATEGDPQGTLVGTLSGKTSGSTLSLTDDSSDRFQLDGLDIEVGSTAITEGSYNITVTETHADGTNSPNPNLFEIEVAAEGEDPLAPPAPTLDLDETSDTGTSNSDDITSDTLPLINVTTADTFLEDDEIETEIDSVSVDVHVVTAGEASSQVLGLELGDALTEGDRDIRMRHNRPSGGDHWSPWSDTLTLTVLTSNPTLSSTVPVDGTTGVTGTANLTATFNKNIAFGSGNITIKKTADDTTVEAFNVATEVGTGNGEVSISGMVLTINPTTALPQEELYVLIDATAIDDLAGNSYAGIASTTAWSFSVADTTAPMIATLTPLDNATDVLVNTGLEVEFSEPVAFGATVDITIFDASDDSVIEAFDETDIGVGIDISGDTLTITPSSDLPYETDIYVQITSGSIEDASSNVFAGIANETTWNFTTAAETAYTGPGDVVASAVAWWGLRAYSDAAAGNNCVRLRRSSDDTEQDFVTLADGSLDVASIATFKGGGSVFVRTLYDQVGTNHMQQATNAQQPELILSGVGALPVIRAAAATPHHMTSGSSITQSQPYTATSVWKCTANAGTLQSAVGSGNFAQGHNNGSPTVFIFAGSLPTTSGAHNAWHTMNAVYNGASSDIGLDGASATVDAGTAANSSAATLFQNGTSNRFTGDLVEFGIWGSAFNGTQIANMDTNQAAYWGI